MPGGAGTVLVMRVQARALLALAAATVIDPGGLQRHEWHGVAGYTCAGSG